MAYAEGTVVPVEKSIAEIIGLVKRAGAVRIGQLDEPESFTIQFFLADRMIRFRVPLPSIEDMPKLNGRRESLTEAKRREILDQRHRQRARALMLVIKAKLESVESKVETFEQAFLANVVMSDGATLHERVCEPIAAEYRTGAPAQMRLSGPGEGAES